MDELVLRPGMVMAASSVFDIPSGLVAMTVFGSERDLLRPGAKPVMLAFTCQVLSMPTRTVGPPNRELLR